MGREDQMRGHCAAKRDQTVGACPGKVKHYSPPPFTWRQTVKPPPS